MTSSSAARPLLWPLVPAYRLALAWRELELHSGLKPVRRLRCPVASIGNLSAGGSGKTPLTIALAKALAARNLPVDVLSRGYGRRSAVAARVDPDGSVADFGDEPPLIARETGVPIYVARERYRAGLLAERDALEKAREQAGTLAGPRGLIHLLDDGFQHRQLARDLDILLLSRGDLTDALLPAGNLREPLHAAERADVIAIPADEPDVAERIASRGWQGAVWRLRRRMEVPPVAGPVAAFCGIARPAQFFQGLESAGLRLATRAVFPDHHNYTARDMEGLAEAARNAGATALLTTEKDYARLGALAASLLRSLPLRTVPLRVEIENEAAAIDRLIDRLIDRVARRS